MLEDKELISIQEARWLTRQAHEAVEVFKSYSQAQVDTIVAAMARAARQNAVRLAELAVLETGLGNVPDKTTKNLFAAVQIHNYIKGLKTCGVIAENKAKKVIDIAVPAGVIAAIIPTTNPTSTAIFKVLCAIKGRNPIVLSPHPKAVKSTIETGRILSEAAVTAGAPRNCIQWMEHVTLEGTNELMRNRFTSLILATGGAGLVRAAYSSGKPAYGVGPGNVPAYIERTADVARAVKDVLAGKTFDYGLLCSSEQTLICDEEIEAQVLEQLRRNRALLVEGEDLEKLRRCIQLPDKKLNTAIVGQSPQVIAKMAGFEVAADVTCLVGRESGVGPDYPLSMEKLSPVLALYVVKDWREGCRLCIDILNFGGLGHTLAIHSRDEGVILEFGLQKPAHRLCVNTPATHGSVGLTTGVPPSMTLGCGTPGGNITSDNITPLHLINIRRLAYGIRTVESISFGEVESPPEAPGVRDSDIREAVRQKVDEYLAQRGLLSGDSGIPLRPELKAKAMQLEAILAEPPKESPKEDPPVDFVCEEDVRQAVKLGKRIRINSKTIVTPAARDLGGDKNVFELVQ